MVIKWDVTIPKLSGDTPRRAYIYLPESYDEEPDRRYPVMYMFDGHNVFFDEDATFGKSWGMNDYMEQSQKELILVGIECNREGNGRLEEYAPFPFDAPDGNCRVYAPDGEFLMLGSIRNGELFTVKSFFEV